MNYGVSPLGVLASFLLGLGGFTLIFTGPAVAPAGAVCMEPDLCQLLRGFFPYSVTMFLSGVLLLLGGFFLDRLRGRART